MHRLTKNNLFTGVTANAYGQAVTLLIQFASVPVLLSAWGAETFGLWLVVSAIPSYFSLADFGFSAVAANDMTLATERGERRAALGVFQSVMALNSFVSLCLIALIVAAVLLTPDQIIPQAARASSGEVRLVWLVQGIQAVATLSCGAFGGGFQSSGHYALGVFLGNSARLMENVALMAAATTLDGLLPAALLMLAIRFAALLGMALVLVRIAPWLSLGFEHARFAEIRRIARPALAAMALPTAFAISLQGVLLVIGAILSLEAVAAFSVVRTLTRAVIQGAVVVNHAIMPEVTRAFGARNFLLISHLTRLNTISVLTLNSSALFVIAGFGSCIVGLWTRGQIVPHWPLVVGLALVAWLHSFWLSRANLILAINKHSGYSYWFLTIAIASVLASIPAARALGIDGVLLPLILAELAMALIVNHAFRLAFGAERLRLPQSNQCNGAK